MRVRLIYFRLPTTKVTRSKNGASHPTKVWPLSRQKLAVEQPRGGCGLQPGVGAKPLPRDIDLRGLRLNWETEIRRGHNPEGVVHPLASLSQASIIH